MNIPIGGVASRKLEGLLANLHFQAKCATQGSHIAAWWPVLGEAIKSGHHSFAS
jgi:hypothetical protein